MLNTKDDNRKKGGEVKVASLPIVFPFTSKDTFEHTSRDISRRYTVSLNVPNIL
jgi:hypothetical protein